MSTSGPSARAFHAMAYDPARGRVVLFGGWDSSGRRQDTWEWDGASWTQASTTGPSARLDHRMVYDAARGHVVLFGGRNGTGMFNDLWEWDGKKWEKKPGGTVLPARAGQVVTYDHRRRKMVMLMGFGPWSYPTGAEWGLTWEWDGTWWRRIEEPGIPFEGRSGPWFQYDRGRGVSVLFGGIGAYQGKAVYTNDTFEWNGKSWKKVKTAHAPCPRVLGVRGYDPSRKVCVLYGGEVTAAWFHDTWEYDGKDWREIKGAWGPVTIIGKMAWRPKSGKLYLFEYGDGSFNRPGPHLWEWDGKVWKDLKTKGFPPSPIRSYWVGVSLFYDEVKDVFFSFAREAR